MPLHDTGAAADHEALSGTRAIRLIGIGAQPSMYALERQVPETRPIAATRTTR